MDQAERIAHHDLCFGCGLANVFGLQLSLTPGAEGEVSGRFFVKQDHQGPPGLTHTGILAAALAEAMALAVDPSAPGVPEGLEVDVHGRAPVGTYVGVTARCDQGNQAGRWAAAELRDDAGQLLAEGRAFYGGDGVEP